MFDAAVWRAARGGATHALRSIPAPSACSTVRAPGPVTLDAWPAASTAGIPDEATLSHWFTEWRDRAWFSMLHD